MVHKGPAPTSWNLDYHGAAATGDVSWEKGGDPEPWLGYNSLEGSVCISTKWALPPSPRKMPADMGAPVPSDTST